MSEEPAPRLHYYKLPPAFISDCLDCGCDIGFYDEGPQLLIDPTQEQLVELRSRAEHYVGDVDQAPPGLKVAARALLKRMDALALGLPEKPGYVMVAGIRR